MFSPRFLAQVAVPFLVLLQRVSAETHDIKFVNQCGFGTPTLMYNGLNVLDGATYTSNGPFSGIAYLQTGGCNVNGENCTLMEMTLINPTCAGCGSSTDISLIPPHVYSVETSFAYYGGCDGTGKTCSNSSCTDAAFFKPTDNIVQVACQENDVNLLVAFCAEASQFVTGNGTTTEDGSASTSAPPVGPGLTMPAPTPTPTPTDYDSGCGDEPETPTTSSLPPANSSGTVHDPGCDEPEGTGMPTPTQTMPTTGGTNAYDQGCDEPEGTGVPTPTQMMPVTGGTTVYDPGCDEPERTETPTSMPTVPAPSQSQPTQLPTNTLSGTDIPDPEETTVPSSSMPDPTATQMPTDVSDLGCEDPEETTTSSLPASSPSATQTPTDVYDSGCEDPGETTAASLPTSLPTSTPTSTPTSSTPTGTGTGTELEHPCDDMGETNTPTSTPTPTQPIRRHHRHRRANVNRIQH